LDCRVDLRQLGLHRSGFEPHVDACHLLLLEAHRAAELAEGPAERRACLLHLEANLAPRGVHRVALVCNRRQCHERNDECQRASFHKSLPGCQGSMRYMTPSRSTKAWRNAAATCPAMIAASTATSPMCMALNTPASARSLATRSGTTN